MINISGLLRDSFGTAYSRRLRRAERLPIVIYGKESPTLLSVKHKDIFYAQEVKGFYEEPLTIEWTNKLGELEKKSVVLKEIQRHPFKNKILHVDFALV